jgi:hypothetical protein
MPTWEPASPSWMPEIRSPKNDSVPSVRAGRFNTKPIDPARAPPSARAAVCGCQSSSCAIRCTRSRVSADTPGRSFRANETALMDTPARAAMSAIVVRRFGAMA